ncbi:MAG: Ig-like domain-containing protein [bacterium]
MTHNENPILKTVWLVIVLLAAISSQAFAQTKIMPLGNSITKGVDGPSTDDAGYRNDLDGLLTAEGVAFDFVGSQSDGAGFDTDHEGHDGFRADQIVAGLGSYLSVNPDVIILHIGSNDISDDQTPESTRDEIESIIDAVHTFDPGVKIILSSIVPRTDDKDDETTTLNTLIEDLFYRKRDDDGRNLYYAGVNELFKHNATWNTDYFAASDAVHPNDDGFNVMARVYFDALMTAINMTTTEVTDNFERSALGITWDADPEFVIQGGDLVNTATTGAARWEYLATYRAIKNPNSVAVKWAADADVAGIDEGGLAVLLDAPTRTADGYLAWISASDNELHLWTITNGSVDVDLLDVNPVSLASPPAAGKIVRVDVTVDPADIKFDYFVDNVFAGSITIANPGLSGDWYAGVILRHDRNNDIDEFSLLKATDTTPPMAVDDLTAGTALATSIPLTWTATGDDGTEGLARRYDLRVSTQAITDANFEAADEVLGVPSPSVAGTLEETIATGLQPGTQYFFAIQVIDEAGNASGISNPASATTVAGNVFSDDFNRTTGLGENWTADAAYDIVNNRLSNTSTDGLWDDIAVLTARKNPAQVSFRFADNSDVTGIDQTGFVIVFDSPTSTASGYAITRRTEDNTLRLWRLVDGAVLSIIDKVQNPLLGPPAPGDVVKIQITSDGTANKFDYYINGVFDGRVEDTAFEYDLSQDNWAGVTLRSNLNNDIDDFTVLLAIGAPASVLVTGGDAQIDTVGRQLPEPLCVKVVDENDSPVQGVNVKFEVIDGGGSVDVSLPSDEIVVEAESGTLHSPMAIGEDVDASNGKFIEVPNGSGGGGGNLGFVEYLINIEQAGDYVMWGRAIYPDAENDAFRVIVGADTFKWDVGQRVHSASWHWDQVSHRGNGTAKKPQLDPVIFSFQAGIQTLIVGEAKDGTKLDQFVLAPVGSGFEPPADQSAVEPGGVFTDAEGLACANLTLGPVPGVNLVQASAVGLPVVTFTATGVSPAIATIEKISGDAQTGAQGQPLPNPFVVQLSDVQGNPAIGAEVNFEVLPPGDGTLSTTNPVIADALGRASTVLTLATNAAVNQVRVTAPGYSGPEVIFTALIPAGDPDRIVPVDGNDQSGTAGQPLAVPFQVRVTDQDDVPIVGHAVSFRVLDGGGSLEGSASREIETDALGIAAVTLTLGPQGGALNRVEAAAQGLAGSPIIFSANAAVAQELEPVSDLQQQGVANLPLPDSMEVRVVDALGGGLPNHDVIFTITAGDGLVNGLAQTVVKTGSQGIARVEWRLGPDIGSDTHTLRAESAFNGDALSGSPIVFISDAEAGPAENLNLVSGNDQTGTIGEPLDEPLRVEITDIDDAPVAGWPVTFEVTAGDGSLEGASSQTVFTDSEGLARVVWTLGPNVGIDNNTVQASAPQTASEIFTASAKISAATTIELVDGLGQTGPAGLPLPTKLKVLVTDKNSNGVVGHIVSFRIEGGDGTINGIAPGDTLEHITSNENGVAEVTWFMGGELGENIQAIEITSEDGLNDLNGSPTLVAATATVGPVDPNESAIDSDKSAVQANGQDQALLTVTLTDRFGNPVAGKAVTLMSDNENDTIGQPQELTNENGQTQGTIASTIAGEHTISARVVGGVQLNPTLELAFLSVAPESVELRDGNNQASNVSTVLPAPIEVLVTDEFGNPVPGITVQFDVTAGGGFILPESSAQRQGAVSGVSVDKITSANGIAQAFWVLGANPGENRAEARAFFDNQELAGSPVDFAATGRISSPAAMNSHGGDNQASGAGAPLPEPLQVRVTDSGGLPVAGVTVEFDVLEGGGSLSRTRTDTDHEGVAATVLTLGPEVGSNRVRAQAPAISGQPAVEFTAEGLSGTPSRMTRVAGHNQSVPVNSAHEISVLITDLNDNPIEGVEVSFEVLSGGATLGVPRVTTDGDGIAATEVQLPTAAGQIRVRVTSGLLPGFFVDFVIQAVAGPAATIAEFGGNGQDGTVGRPLVLPLQVQVTDAFGNPIAGHPVSWQTDSGNTVTPPNTTTNADGLASTRFTIVNLGENTAEATASDLSGSPVAFAANGVENNFPEFIDLTDHQVSEGNLLFFEVNAFDADGDPVTYEAGNVPNGADFNPNNGAFVWTPSEGQNGVHEVTFIARDNRGGFDTGTISITVHNSNNPPVITQFTPEEMELRFILTQVIVFSVTVTDADNDDLQYSWMLFKGVDTEGEEVSQVSTYVMDTSLQEPASYTVRVTVTDGKDEVSQEWKVDVVTSVELASFMAQFTSFDGIEISWTTSREVNNAGFDVLRSSSENGTYTKLNDELIPRDEKGIYQFIDQNVEVGRRYYYLLEDVDVNGVRTQHGPIAVDIAAPETFWLSQNYPNPFNPETRIRYQLPQTGKVMIKIFDVLGREVRRLLDERKEAGFHIVTWDARDNSGTRVSSGIYYYQIVAGEFRQTRKMLLVK